MEDNLVNDRVIRFLSEHISSIAQLEILLLLQTNPQQRWSTQSVVLELRTDATGTQFELDLLCRSGLLKRTDAFDYFYSPASAELHDNTVALARAYLLRRVTVIGLIFAKPPGGLQAFSDAFRLRKEPPDAPRS